jgi:molecular chaperone HtpG
MSTSVQRASIDELEGTGARIAGNVVVGKDILELLTGAMYVDPLTIYREYVQNAADAITLADAQGHYLAASQPRLEIHLDDRSRSIRIRDNGIAVAASEFWRRMTSVGASGKRGQGLRGFRGVGRLSGLGYAQEVVFRSRARNETTVSEISWDSRRLRELLRDAHYGGDIEDAVRSIVSHKTTTDPRPSDGFFEVELRRVARIKNDLLLNPDEVRRYLTQVAPVPFRPDFLLGAQIQSFLGKHGVDSGLHIVVSGDDTPIYRPFGNAIEMKPKVKDRFHDLEVVEIAGIDGITHAVGWILHHSYLGSIPRRTGIAGLRVRAGNIQIGGSNLLESSFLEPRFNTWCVGEFHIVTDRILPNGRRDDFELNAHYQNFHGHAAALANRLSRICRDRSMQRNRLRKADILTKAAKEQLIVVRDPATPSLVRDHYRNLIDKTVARLGRMSTDPKFSAEEKSQIAGQGEALAAALGSAPAARLSSKTLAFLPPRQRKVFLETLKMAIAACDTPDQAARMARKVFERARRRKYS